MTPGAWQPAMAPDLSYNALVERLKRINLAPMLSRWGALGSLVIGILSFLLGAALVAKHANSNDGSPFGWLFIVIGICGLLAAFGFVTGLYD